jgi:hypothetical protein
MLGRSANAEMLAVRTSETERGTQTMDVLGRVRTAIPPIVYDPRLLLCVLGVSCITPRELVLIQSTARPQMEDKGCALPVGAVLPDGTEFRVLCADRQSRSDPLTFIGRRAEIQWCSLNVQ